MSHASFASRLRMLCLAALLAGYCFAAPAQTAVALHNIMSGLPSSPYLGQTVQTTGVVVGVMSTGGFYLSSQDSDWDNLLSTAEGMPVYPNTVSACDAVAVGDVMTVTGTVANSTVVNAANTPATGIQPAACSKSGTATVTRSIDLSTTGALASFGDALKFTGMSATDASFAAISPTGGSADGSGVVTSNGQFWGVLSSSMATNNHLFRSLGIAGDEYVPAGAPAGVPTWSGNPARVLIDTKTFGGNPVDVTVGQTITCTAGSGITAGATAGIGVIDYTLGYARLLIFKTTTCTAAGTVPPSVSAIADATHFKVATLDVNAFLGPGSIASTSAALPTALPKAVQTVTGVFGSPDMFALQQVGDQTTLQYLADAANTANGGSTNYIAAVPGTDQINSGFLINTTTVKNANFVESGRGATYTAGSGSTATLWDHPPVVMTGEFARVGKNYPVTVINVDFASRDGIDDPVLGPDIRARRAAQAVAVSTLVQGYQSAGANVIVAGNFNGYEYNDGYVDVAGIVDGVPAAQGTVALYQASNTTAPLTDFTTQVATNTRYNVIERGNAAAVEHMMASATVTDTTTASAPLASYVNAVTQPHFSADYAAVNANDPTTPAGLTPHDGFLVNFAIPPVPTSASLTPNALNFGNVYIGGSGTLQLTFTNTTAFTSTVNVTGIAISGTNSADYNQTNNCTSLGMGQSCTINVTFVPAAKGTRFGTITVMSDSVTNPTLTASLTGNGLDTRAALTPRSADFGTQILGTSSSPKTFIWTNTSPTSLPIFTVDVTGDYSITATTCLGQIAANSTCSVSVVFTPATLGTRPGTLTVTSASSLNGALTASLTSTGVASVQVSASTLSFGTVDVSATSTPQTFTLTNNTNAAVAINGITVSGDYAETNACGNAIAPHSTCAVNIVFTPTATGVRGGVLTIVTSGTTTPSITVALTGNGVDFSIGISPASGNAIAGLSVSSTATVTPLGGFNAPVTMGCATAASGTGCAYAKSSFTMSAAVPDALTITTTSKYTVIGYGHLLFGPGRRGILPILLGMCALAALWDVRRRTAGAARLLMALAATGLLAGGLSGCSGKDPDLNSPYTAPGTYTIQVTATDGIITHSAAYSLVVTAK